MGQESATSERLRSEDRARVRLLTFQRPEALNAFDDALYDAVRRALAEAASSPEISVVILTGAGRAFSAGQDLGELEAPPRHEDGAPHGFTPFIETLEAFPKPLIAAVNGVAVGIGVTMLPHCDLVLVAEGARLRVPFVELGVVPEAGSTWLLPATLGWQEAARLFYTAAWMEAPQAVEIGLAWRCVPAVRLLDEAFELAAAIARQPLASLMETRRLLLATRLEAVRAARARESESFAKLLGGPSNRAALEAFRARRGSS